MLFGVALTADGAGAQATAITGRVLDGGDPVAGATVEVELAGDPVGEDTTGSDGTFRVVVPNAGTYLARLDEASLPEGVALGEDDLSELPRVVVQPGTEKVVVFTVGPAPTSSARRRSAGS